MATDDRESIRLLKQVIRKKRVHMGLPPEGKLDVTAVVEALKEQPPVEEIVNFVKNALNEDAPTPTPRRSKGMPQKRFDIKA